MRLIEQNFKILVGTLVTILVLTTLAITTFPDGKLHVYFLDIGQGDSIMIQTPSNYKILVDGGPNRRVLTQVGKVLPFWDKKIDLLISTNPDKDHIEGLNSILEDYIVDKIWLSKDTNTTQSFEKLIANIEKFKIEADAPVVGDHIIVGDGSEIWVLWPKTRDPQVPTINEGSIVVLLKYKEFTTLLTGDAESTTQPYEGLDKEIDVLKVPHHGSQNGLEVGYLNVLKPEIAVISAGKNNRYGLPHQSVLDQLASVSAKIFKTYEVGNIEVVSDGKTWYTRTER